MAALVKLCGAAVALGGIIFWGTTWAPSAPIDQLDAERARRRLKQDGFEDVRVHDIDRWLTSVRHDCPGGKSVAVQVWAHDSFGTLFNFTVCCDEGVDHRSCTITH